MGYTHTSPTTADQGQALLLEIQRRCREATARGCDANPSEIAALLGMAVLDARSRDATLLYLGAFLARCLTGSVPDPQVWFPFL